MGSRNYLRLAALALLVAAWPPTNQRSALASATNTLTGRVVDEAGAPVSAARITLTRQGHVLRAESGEAGGFELPGVEPGAFELRVEKAGFYSLVKHEFVPPAGGGPVELVLNHQQEYEEKVDVVYAAPAIDFQKLPAAATLTAREITDLPYPTSHDFRNGLPVLPGVIQDGSKRIHLNGGTEDQVLYTLNGFDLTEPYLGTLENHIPVDAIREIQTQSSRYSAEFGKSSAGTLAIESNAGDDHFRYNATNFVPSGQLSGGPLLGKWTPRGAVSGPWRRARAWFFNGADAQYNVDQVHELPAGANRNTRWNWSDLFRNQFLLGHSNLLSATFLANYSHQNHYGLGPLDPLEATRVLGERNYFLAFKDQQYLPRGILLEVGLAASRWRAESDPLGTALYRISPNGQSGNHFERARLVSRRRQGLVNAVLPPHHWHGRHEWKLGADLDEKSFDRELSRLPIEVLRSDGTLSARRIYTGPPKYRLGAFEQSFYAQDHWEFSERAALEVGLRQDWNDAVDRGAWSPRLALAVAPFRGHGTRLTAGWGMFYDTVDLEILTRNLDQSFDELDYSADGTRVVSGPTPLRFAVPLSGLRLPRTGNLSAGVEQQLPAGFLLRAGYIRRRTSDAFTFLTDPLQEGFRLGNQRHDRYDALEIRAEHGLAKGYRWVGAYTRSSARSDAALNFSATQPIFGTQGEGPLDWDAPNRLLSWAWLPLRQRYGLAYLVEYRSGFPFSVFSERSGLVSSPNSRRFPRYFNLNLELERRFRLGKYLWALRAGFINITNHKNPNFVVNTLESPNFRQFSGGQRRALVTRIRLIGKN